MLLFLYLFHSAKVWFEKSRIKVTDDFNELELIVKNQLIRNILKNCFFLGNIASSVSVPHCTCIVDLAWNYY